MLEYPSIAFLSVFQAAAQNIAIVGDSLLVCVMFFSPPLLSIISSRMMFTTKEKGERGLQPKITITGPYGITFSLDSPSSPSFVSPSTV